MDEPLLLLMTSIFRIWLIGISFCKIVIFVVSTLPIFAREDRLVLIQSFLGYIVYVFHIFASLSIAIKSIFEQAARF